MFMELKTEEEAKKYFEKAAKTCSPGAIMLYHNQRKTVLRVLREAAENGGRKFIEKDLSTLENESMGSTIFENEMPSWIKEVFDEKNKEGYLLYLREFHFASDRIKNEAMNVILNREVEAKKFPDNTLIVMGILDRDDITAAIRDVHTVRFYR